MKNEKILLDLKGLQKSKFSSIDVSADLNDTLIKLFSQIIKKNKKLDRENQMRELRKTLFMGRRDS